MHCDYTNNIIDIIVICIRAIEERFLGNEMSISVFRELHEI